MGFKDKIKRMGRNKYVQFAGVLVAASLITTGIGMSTAKQQEKIDKYIDDKEGYAIATTLVDDLNETMEAEGSDVQYSNPQYRGMIAHRDTGANPHEEVIEVFVVAENENKPYMIKATIDNEKEKVSEKADSLLSTYNPHIVKYNIIENIDNLEVTYDVVPTTLETLKLLDEMGNYSSPFNSPERDSQHLDKSVIAGYSVSKNDDGTLKVTVSSNMKTAHLQEGLLSSEEHDYYNKEVSFNIDSAENIEEKIFDYLLKINLKDKESLEVKYSRAGISTDYQGSGKTYELKGEEKTEKATTETTEKATTEAEEENLEPEM